MEFTFKGTITVTEDQRKSLIDHLVEMKIAEQKRRRIELANDYYTWAAYYFPNLPSAFVSAYNEFLKEIEKNKAYAKAVSPHKKSISWEEFGKIYLDKPASPFRGFERCRCISSADLASEVASYFTSVYQPRPKKKLLAVATRDLPVSSKDSIKIEKGKIYELKSYTITNHPIFEHRNYEYVVLIDGKECKINSSLCFFDIDQPNI
ncbi:hypothetical protein [Dysgonomonas sp. ZJ279]|uniref:hypothetical protein n=1 Tax=Dysgonomonas sp. ZJ279 TaxID=2709796 RepID=UPI0013EAFAE4|nr:hypothetical protein [Dysgonomonas sp. ZJ279]